MAPKAMQAAATWLAGLARALAGFFRDRRGGGMLMFMAAGITMLVSVGAMMTNYAWREAQLEEVRGALRASVAATGALLARAGEAAIQQQIKDRVSKVISGLVDGLRVSKDDVSITTEAGRRIVTVTVGGSARYKFEDLWGGDNGGVGSFRLPDISVSVQIESFRYEVAIAADLTSSMHSTIPNGEGGSIAKIQALRDAIDAAATVLEARNSEVGGGVSAAIVPFGQAVNVADTSGSGQTASKERYVYMLAGAEHSSTEAGNSTEHWVDVHHGYGHGDNMGELQYRTLPLFDGSNSWNFDQAETIDISTQAPGFSSWDVQGSDFWNGCVMARWGAYWNRDGWPSVDGSAVTVSCSDDMTVLENCEWTGGTDYTDVSGISCDGLSEARGTVFCSIEQPENDDTTTPGSRREATRRYEASGPGGGVLPTRLTRLSTPTSGDFIWNGNSPDASFWPARKNVDAWTPASAALTGEPLHLSDAPPEHSDPNTRFTAYSWPDARVLGTADARMQAIIAEFLLPTDDGDGVGDSELVWAASEAAITIAELRRLNQLTQGKHDNNWDIRGRNDPSNEQLDGQLTRGGDGSSGCPGRPILPLTDSATTLRDAGNALQVVPVHQGTRGATMLHLGVVWGLRALSPLWRDIWSVSDSQGADRPLTACADQEIGAPADNPHCQQSVRKSILLLTDGVNGFGALGNGRVGYNQTVFFHRQNVGTSWNNDIAQSNPIYGPTTSSWCEHITNRWNVAAYGNLARAADRTTEAAFNSAMGGAFTSGARLNRLLAAFDDVMLSSKSSGANARTLTQSSNWTTILSGITPWELFVSGIRGGSTNVVDQLVLPSNGFGFDGRPQHGGMACRLWSPFTAYGRVGDRMQVGGHPVEGVAPFALQSSWSTTAAVLNPATGGPVSGLMDGWMDEACRIAAARDVEIRAIYIGERTNTDAIGRLRACLTAAGESQDNLYITPTSAALKSSFEQIFNLGRSIRFLN